MTSSIVDSQSPLGVVARLRDIRVSFGVHDAITGIHLDIRSGAITAIAGPNGAGKSTLLEVLAGTIRPSTGTRDVNGVVRHGVAFVPQRAAISDRLPVTVRDVVTVGAWGRSGPWRRIGAGGRAAVEAALEMVQLTALAKHPFGSLSGGQRQRALLAQGLACRADLLLLDEPTTGLDAATTAAIRRVMRSEARRGAAVVCVSHDPAVLADADHLVRLDSGRLVDASVDRARPSRNLGGAHRSDRRR